MTLVVVLMLGLGLVLIASAIETDPKTGKSVPVMRTISDVWNDQLDFSQPGAANSATNGGGAGGVFSYVPPSPSTTTLAASTYQNAAVAAYLKTRTV